jgi:hypothetical protein
VTSDQDERMRALDETAWLHITQADEWRAWARTLTGCAVALGLLWAATR